MDTTTSLSQYSVIFLVKKVFSDVQMESHLFQFTPIASCAVTEHH